MPSVAQLRLHDGGALQVLVWPGMLFPRIVASTVVVQVVKVKANAHLLRVIHKAALYNVLI